MKIKGRRWIIIGAILLIFLVWVIGYFGGEKVDVHVTKMTTFEEKIKVSAVFLRDETVYRTENGGIILGDVRNGSKVSAGTEIAAIYQGGLDGNKKQEIEELNRQIEALSQIGGGNVNFSSDLSSIEGDLKQSVNEITTLAIEEDLTNLDVYKVNLEEVLNVGIGGVVEKTIEELSVKREEIKKSITTPHENIYAVKSGIFIPFTDGYEEALSSKNYNTITPAIVEDTIKSAKNINATSVLEYGAGEAVCKTVSNTEWMIACVVTKDDLYKGLKDGLQVELRFGGNDKDTAQGEVIRLYSEDDEKFICVIKAGDAARDVYSDRICEVEIVTKSYTGLSVPAGAIRFKGEVPGVFVNTNGVAKFKETNILYSDDNIAIVESNITATGRLRMYDSVILNRDGIYEGKAVKQ